MNFGRTKDIALNIILPILLGIVLYGIRDMILLPTFINNHLADGLWAYAFASTILIIWERTINIVWLITALFIAVSFELLQYCHLIKGTGDVYDLTAYTISFILALLSNKLFKKLFNSEIINHVTN